VTVSLNKCVFMCFLFINMKLDISIILPASTSTFSKHLNGLCNYYVTFTYYAHIMFSVPNNWTFLCSQQLLFVEPKRLAPVMQAGNIIFKHRYIYKYIRNLNYSFTSVSIQSSDMCRLPSVADLSHYFLTAVYC